MAQQEEGWPLGLQPLTVRVGLVRSHDYSGSVSFNTLHTGSPTSSTDSSSDLDTESTGSFFHDRSITLGSLLGVSSILELSKRSVRRGRNTETTKDKKAIQGKSKNWLFSLCMRNNDEPVANTMNHAPSLGHFLAVEKRAADEHRRSNISPIIHGYVPNELAPPHSSSETNSLFVNGYVAPPQARGCDSENGEAENANERGLPLVFLCMCGQHS